MFLNKTKKKERKHMQSIHENPQPLQTMVGTKVHSVKEMMMDE